MTRVLPWALFAAAGLLMAVMFRYDVINERGNGVVRLDRWTGSIENCVASRLGFVCLTARPFDKEFAEMESPAGDVAP